MGKFTSSALRITWVVLLTVFVFILTRSPWTGGYSLHLTLVSLIGLLIYLYGMKKRGVRTQNRWFVVLFTTFVLFLVGSTGWFYSPFFFSLYLLAMYLSFVSTATVAIAFVSTLVGLFSFNIGEVDLAYDFLVVLSLILTIPLCLYVRKQYLKLKQAENEILVLDEGNGERQDSLHRILANKIHSFATELREPLNDVKQIAYRLEKLDTKKEREEHRERIIASAESALTTLKSFEEQVTGLKLLTTPKTVSPLKAKDQE